MGTWDCRKPITERFWARVRKTDACWLWTGTTTLAGYGQLRVNGKKIYTHRFVLALFGREVPSGLVVMHSCDVPACVNPDHLSVGTDGDNVRDAVRKGRHVSPQTKYSEICVRGHTKRVSPSGRRRCRVCEKNAALARQMAEAS